MLIGQKTEQLSELEFLIAGNAAGTESPRDDVGGHLDCPISPEHRPVIPHVQPNNRLESIPGLVRQRVVLPGVGEFVADDKRIVGAEIDSITRPIDVEHSGDSSTVD